MKRTSIALGAILLFTGAALAVQAASSSAPAQDPNDPSAIICKPGTEHTGSRIPGAPECHSKAQWDAMQRDARANLEKMQQPVVTRPE